MPQAEMPFVFHHFLLNEFKHIAWDFGTWHWVWWTCSSHHSLRCVSMPVLLSKFNLLCSLNINRFLPIWRGLSPCLQLTASMCNGKECDRLELDTTSLVSSRHSLMLLTRIVSTATHPWLLLTIAVLPQNLVIAHTAKWSCRALNITLSNQKCSKTGKIHLQSQSLKAGSLMIQKLKMRRAPNIISNMPTCLSCLLV